MSAVSETRKRLPKDLFNLERKLGTEITRFLAHFDVEGLTVNERIALTLLIDEQLSNMLGDSSSLPLPSASLDAPPPLFIPPFDPLAPDSEIFLS